MSRFVNNNNNRNRKLKLNNNNRSRIIIDQITIRQSVCGVKIHKNKITANNKFSVLLLHSCNSIVLYGATGESVKINNKIVKKFIRNSEVKIDSNGNAYEGGINRKLFSESSKIYNIPKNMILSLQTIKAMHGTIIEEIEKPALAYQIQSGLRQLDVILLNTSKFQARPNITSLNCTLRDSSSIDGSFIHGNNVLNWNLESLQATLHDSSQINGISVTILMKIDAFSRRAVCNLIALNHCNVKKNIQSRFANSLSTISNKLKIQRLNTQHNETENNNNNNNNNNTTTNRTRIYTIRTDLEMDRDDLNHEVIRDLLQIHANASANTNVMDLTLDNGSYIVQSSLSNNSNNRDDIIEALRRSLQDQPKPSINIHDGSIPRLYKLVHLGITDDELKEIDEEASNDEFACVICLTNKPIVGLSCGHKNICYDCDKTQSRTSNKCPECRQKITQATIFLDRNKKREKIKKKNKIEKKSKENNTKKQIKRQIESRKKIIEQNRRKQK